MKDFEVNPIGYAEEVRLSRDLVNKMIGRHDINDFHSDVALAVKKLLALYEKQREEGIQ